MKKGQGDKRIYLYLKMYNNDTESLYEDLDHLFIYNSRKNCFTDIKF